MRALQSGAHRMLVLVMLALLASAKALSISEIYQSVKAAVVKLTVFDQHGTPLKTGTGFFVSPDGVLVTNRHVVENGSSIAAEAQNGAIYLCEGVLNLPEGQDIAVLKFKASDQAFIHVSGASQTEPGQKVVVIGAPLGLENTVSDGIVAALRQESGWIQITAPISPGSSGSPVFAEDGALIGVATLSLVNGQQVNFAIPSRFIAAAIEKMGTSLSPLPVKGMARTASALTVEPEEIKRAREGIGKSPLEAMRIANRYLQQDPSDYFAWRLRVAAADVLGLQDEYWRSLQGEVRNLPDDLEACSSLVSTLYWGSISKSDRRVAPFLKQVAEKAISLGDENSVAWEALVRAYQLLGDENTAKEISDKMHALIEQGELQLSAGVRRYQGASWTAFEDVARSHLFGGEVKEDSDSIQLRRGQHTWTFPLEQKARSLPECDGRPWVFDRNYAIRIKHKWHFSYEAFNGPINALAEPGTYFSKVDYQRIYLKALESDEAEWDEWSRFNSQETQSLFEALKRRSAKRLRILQPRQALPDDGILVAFGIYLARDPLADVSAAISLSRYGSEEPYKESKSWSEQVEREMRSYVYEEALRRSLNAVLPQRKDVSPPTPTLSIIGKSTHGTAPQVTLSIEYNKGSQLPISAEKLADALERSLDELKSLTAGKTE